MPDFKPIITNRLYVKNIEKDGSTVSAKLLAQSVHDASEITHFKTIKLAVEEAQSKFSKEGFAKEDALDFAVSCVEVDDECFYAVYFSDKEIDADDDYAIANMGFEEAQKAWELDGVILESYDWAL